MKRILGSIWLKNTPFFIQPITLAWTLIVILAHFFLPGFIYKDDQASLIFFCAAIGIMLLLLLVYNLFAESKY